VIRWFIKGVFFPASFSSKRIALAFAKPGQEVKELVIRTGGADDDTLEFDTEEEIKTNPPSKTREPSQFDL
jgi:hypothetical protein